MSEQDPTPETPETPEVEPVALSLSDDAGRTAQVMVHPDLLESMFDHGATPVVYVTGPGSDPEAHGDSFAVARQRVLNAIHELQHAAMSHSIMTQREQPMSFARHIAEEQAILVFNMLGQAGLMEARMVERQQQMQTMAEEKSIHLPNGEEVKVK